MLEDFYDGNNANTGATDYALGTAGVDYTQGFGHVRTSNVFPLDGAFDTFLYEQDLPEYSTWVQAYAVTPGADTEVDVTLVWNDPPGSIYCGYLYQDGHSSDTCLVHDLDLEVYVTNGLNVDQQFFPNFGAASSTSTRVFAQKADFVNNVEKI